METHGLSQRQATKLLDRPRSTIRYQVQPRSAEPQLRRDIRRLARRHRRFGYKRIHVMLLRKGWKVNVKRVHRLWNDMGLRLRKPKKKRAKLGPRGSSVNSCFNRPAEFRNDVWTYDFVLDRPVDGRPLRWLTLVDEYTRECLALAVSRSLKGEDVRRVLARVIGRHGAPRQIRSDNG
jgi:putative transposase